MQVETLKTGTTTVGIICKDGVVLASEKKSTLGYMVDSKEAKKIYQVDDHIAVTTAGAVGDNLTIVRLLKAQFKLYKINRGPITVKAATTLLSNVLNGSRYYPYITQMIVGGYDSSEGAQIYSIDPFGGYDHQDKFYATGSGSPFAYGVLESDFKENITVEDGLKLALKAVKTAVERDIASGGKGFAAMTITKDGCKELTPQQIKQYV